ncbi:hypothetical protein M426DRAFT_21856 [Hypoxylon sp. CI-4A]|nr:hypothetical protein M426DRAFT_21856 [Hypoxylon sp. CI-4A]
MTLTEAHAIQSWLAEQQFPTAFSGAIFFALFKTYSVPSISRLLVSTRQFGRPGDIEATSKRAADTSVLLTNMIMRPPGSPQARQAVARTNYLHNIYRRTGRISNDDMLYTLSLFILEAIRWTDKYEWRRLTDTERCAMATCFKAWGEDLEISYEALASQPQGWADGLHWLDELDAWSRQYEGENVAPSDTNVEIVAATKELVLCQVPRFLHGLVWSIVSILLGPRVCQAMRVPDSSWIVKLGFNIAVSVRKCLLRYFLPPRPHILRRVYNAPKPDPRTGHYQSQRWLGRPWFMPEGYLIHDVGPENQSHVDDASYTNMFVKLLRTHVSIVNTWVPKCPSSTRVNVSRDQGTFSPHDRCLTPVPYILLDSPVQIPRASNICDITSVLQLRRRGYTDFVVTTMQLPR